jgi:hypothetical protein
LRQFTIYVDGKEKNTLANVGRLIQSAVEDAKEAVNADVMHR